MDGAGSADQPFENLSQLRRDRLIRVKQRAALELSSHVQAVWSCVQQSAATDFVDVDGGLQRKVIDRIQRHHAQ